MYKVQALDTYTRKSVKDVNLGYIPKKGEIFFVPEERLDVLQGNNPYHEQFVHVIEQVKNG